jgi:hypothetical protein
MDAESCGANCSLSLLPCTYHLSTLYLPAIYLSSTSVFYSRENVRSPESPEGLSLTMCQTRSQSVFFSHSHKLFFILTQDIAWTVLYGGTKIFFFKKFSLQMKEILSSPIKNAVFFVLEFMFCLLKSYVLLSAVKELYIGTIIILSMYECKIESLEVINSSKWIILLWLLFFFIQYTIGCTDMNFKIGC